MLRGHCAAFTLAATLLTPLAIAQEPASTDAQAAAASEPDKFDLSVGIDEPVLMSISVTGQAKVGVQMPTGVFETTIPVSGSVKFVDRFDVIDDEKGRYESLRTYLQYFSEEDGKISDPCFNGLTVRLVEDERLQVTVEETRLIPGPRVTQLLDQVNFSGGYIPLPEKIGIDEPFQLPIHSLIRTLIPGEPGSSVELKESIFQLREVDDEGRARVTGQAQWTEVIPDPQAPLEAEATGEFTLWIDLVKGRLESVSMKTKGQAKGQGDLANSVRAEIQLDAELKTTWGKDAEKALQSHRPKFREVPRGTTIGGVAVEFALPSSWATLDSENGVERYLKTTDHSEDSAAVMFLQPLGLGDVSLSEAREVCDRDFKTLGVEYKIKNTKSVLGKGIRIESDADDGYKYIADIFPLGNGHWVMLKIGASPSQFKKARIWFESAQKTLKKVDP